MNHLPIFSTDIAPAALAAKLDPRLVEAVVIKESSGNTWAWNPEPQYHYLWDVQKNKPFRPLTKDEIKSETPPNDWHFFGGDRDQEWWGQQASWGLMQVMGAVARELQFRGLFLTELCHPATGLAYGCKHLARQLRLAQGGVPEALSRYNSGQPKTPQGAAYADAVLSIYADLPKL